MRLLPAVTLTAASFTLLTSAASAATLTAVTQNARTSDPTAWMPPHEPMDHDTLVVPAGVAILIDRDLRLGGLEADGGNVRLASGVQVSLGGKNDFNGLTLTGAPNARLDLADDTRIAGTLRVLNGLTITTFADLTFTGLVTVQTGGGTVTGEPVFRLQRGTTTVDDPIQLNALTNGGENAIGFTKHAGVKLPKGRYKLVVRAITKDGVSAPLVQEVTIG